MWQHPPVPASANVASDRISRLPTETEADRKVLQSLQSLDQYVRELYDESIRTSGPILRGTDEVRFGRKYMGMVALPEYINSAIAAYLQPKDKKHLRYDYLPAYTAARRTSRGVGAPGTPLKPHTLEYGVRESAAYLASYAPATYGVVFNILTELADRLPGFRPRDILDFGSGPATALWAAQEIWPQFERYQGIDISEDMLQCAESLVDATPEDKHAKSIDFVRYLAPNDSRAKSDLVISAFTLSELPSDAVRKTTVETLWNHTKDTLVLVDRGTPDAARMISEARNQLLALDEGPLPQGIHTFAPVPNDLADPTQDTMAWLHFSQRTQRPSYTMLTKHAKSNVEDLRYSYIIMRRGPRPAIEPFEPGEPSLEWPRVVLPPLKRKGHVVVDVCTSKGKIERWTFTKSHDKQAYRDSRKANWGDLFPHVPKSITVRPGFEPRAKPDPAEKKNKTSRKVYRTSSVLDKQE
ncbi:Rsm22-domain-containing protein [Martensiomyces pterosporus]|nr:Rsm22-domain-containing protein [Martensiomyces pterosporus]